MSCCVFIVNYLKNKFDIFGLEFDNFLNNILEIKTNSDSKEYNFINLNEIKKKKNKDHIIIDVPITRDYDII